MMVEQKRIEATKPWAPASVLTVPEQYKMSGWRYRWVSKNRPGRIQKMKEEGWIIDQELGKKIQGEVARTIEDGTPVDSTTQMRELIIMRIPEHLAKQREKYYANQSARKTEAASLELDASGQGYGELKRK
jgi:hypothetical protein